ncbi:hypothetical protein OCU04_002244 [Sclerotinia nivalis]|uniref:Uncharacterized protein n=1 Tax=Sclerotinia nivalis TaxID=352851 RepID=A0A9X0DRC0_9HELO|nr:hypothetical protein OCU04_002244 [Sclerotinia nivalis]
MSSSKKILLPDSERRSSLRARIPRAFENKEASKSPPKVPKPLTKRPTTATVPTDLTVGTAAMIGTAGTYRSILPRPEAPAVLNKPFKATAITSPSFSSSVPRKKIKLNHTPLFTPRNNITPSTLFSGFPKVFPTASPTTEKSPKAKGKQIVIGSATSFNPSSSASNRSSNLNYKCQSKSSPKAIMLPKWFKVPPPKHRKRRREEFEEDEYQPFVIRGGQLGDNAEYTFTKADFDTILEVAPHFKSYLATPDSTSIKITGYFGSSLKVLIQWLTTNTLQSLEVHKPGRRDGQSSYHFVDTYTMANTFRLSAMCDELMDLALKELWGSDDEEDVLPDIRDLYTVYQRTKPGNPLRKLYIAVFDWLLTSDECNRLRSKSKISSPDLWNLLKGSGHAGVDYINYARSQMTDRGTYVHPLDPRKWNACELHQHTIDELCPCWEKRETARRTYEEGRVL